MIIMHFHLIRGNISIEMTDVQKVKYRILIQLGFVKAIELVLIVLVN